MEIPPDHMQMTINDKVQYQSTLVLRHQLTNVKAILQSFGGWSQWRTDEITCTRY
ncbi:MAG: hypothetical protein N4A74_20215 [Carboxylicivirga sp.]|nr:hypothetical protein [Carboxylicivirga sp.]